MAKLNGAAETLRSIELVLDTAGIDRRENGMVLTAHERVERLIDSHDRMAGAVQALAFGDGEHGD